VERKEADHQQILASVQTSFEQREQAIVAERDENRNALLQLEAKFEADLASAQAKVLFFRLSPFSRKLIHVPPVCSLLLTWMRRNPRRDRN